MFFLAKFPVIYGILSARCATWNFHLLNSPVAVAVHLSAISLPWTQPCVVLNHVQFMSWPSVPLHATLATIGPSPCPNVVLATRAVEPAIQILCDTAYKIKRSCAMYFLQSPIVYKPLEPPAKSCYYCRQCPTG